MTVKEITGKFIELFIFSSEGVGMLALERGESEGGRWECRLRGCSVQGGARRVRGGGLGF